MLDDSDEVGRDHASQARRVEELLPNLLAVLPEMLDQFFFDSSLSKTAAERYTTELAKALLTWMDEQRYDPWANLASLELNAALFAKAMEFFVQDDEGRFVWRPGVAMISQEVLRDMHRIADAFLRNA